MMVLERRKIEDMPVVDVAPAVRCEYCKYCLEEDEFEYWCYGFCSPARLVRKDDFCSYWKAKNIVPFQKCQGCAYLNPKNHYCEKYLRGIEKAVCLCSTYRANENEEMSKVSKMEIAYGEYLND